MSCRAHRRRLQRRGGGRFAPARACQPAASRKHEEAWWQGGGRYKAGEGGSDILWKGLVQEEAGASSDSMFIHGLTKIELHVLVVGLAVCVNLPCMGTAPRPAKKVLWPWEALVKLISWYFIHAIANEEINAVGIKCYLISTHVVVADQLLVLLKHVGGFNPIVGRWDSESVCKHQDDSKKKTMTTTRHSVSETWQTMEGPLHTTSSAHGDAPCFGILQSGSDEQSIKHLS